MAEAPETTTSSTPEPQARRPNPNVPLVSSLTRSQISEQNTLWQNHVQECQRNVVNLRTGQTNLQAAIDAAIPAAPAAVPPEIGTDIQLLQNAIQDLQLLSQEHQSGNDESAAWWTSTGQNRYVDLRREFNTALQDARDNTDFWRTAEIDNVTIRSQIDLVLRSLNQKIKPTGDFGNPAKAKENHAIIEDFISEASKLLSNMRAAVRKDPSPVTSIKNPARVAEFVRRRDEVCAVLDAMSREELWSRSEFADSSKTIAATAEELDEALAKIRGQSIDLQTANEINARIRRFLRAAENVCRKFERTERGTGRLIARDRPSDFVFHTEPISSKTLTDNIQLDRRTALKALLGLAAVPTTYYVGKGILGSLFRKKNVPEEQEEEKQQSTTQPTIQTSSAPSSQAQTVNQATPEQDLGINGFSVHREGTKLVYTLPPNARLGIDTKIFLGKRGMNNLPVVSQVINGRLEIEIPQNFLQGGGTVRTLVQHWNGSSWDVGRVFDIAL